MTMRLSHACVALLLLAGGGGAGMGAVPDLVDPASRTRFPAERPFPGQKSLRLQAIGIASRATARVDEYCMGLYVDLAGLKTLAGREREPAALAELLCTGKVAVGFPRRFLRGVGRRFRKRSLQPALARFWPEPGFDPAAPSVQALLGAVDQDLQRGDWVGFWCDGRGTLVYQVNEGSLTRIADPALCRAFIRNYLLADPGEGQAPVWQELLARLPERMTGGERLP